MTFLTLPTGPLEVNCYILGSKTTGQAVVIDPGGDVDSILKKIEDYNLSVQWIINTHGHFDHIGGNKALVERTGAVLMIHEDDIPLMQRAEEHAAGFGLQTVKSPAPAKTFQHGDILELNDMTLEVIHTPGHSPGGVCLLVGNILIVGDTLFAGSIGRTDLPGGDHQQLIDNIKTKLLVLPDETKVCPGHGPMTSIGQEKRFNPFLS